MKWKSGLIIIVVNIFLLLAYTMLHEYNNLSNRFSAVENTVKEALNSAIQLSIGSEELFTSNYQEEMLTSKGIGNTGSTLIWLPGANRFEYANLYLLAYYNEKQNKFPSTTNDIITLNNQSNKGVLNGETGFIYEWLYGTQASDYNDTRYKWANRSTTKKQAYKTYLYGGTTKQIPNRDSATVNPEFKAFYNNVGKLQKTAGKLKIKDGDSFNLENSIYPTLDNMGFKFMRDNKDLLETNDNFMSSFHVGKSLAGNEDTYYYLTPRSLGVTYIPTNVLKTAFINNLDIITRLNYLGGTNFDKDKSVILSGADTSAETMINTGSGFRKTNKTKKRIVTDGHMIVDLDSAQVKVDYFYVDFTNAVHDTNLQNILLKTNGAIQKYNGTLLSEAQSKKETAKAFLDIDNDTVTKISDTDLRQKFNTVRNGRIIARVTAKVKVHIPYKTPLLQWFNEKFNKTNSDFYSIKRYNPSKKGIDNSEDIWYTYTTYYTTTRS